MFICDPCHVHICPLAIGGGQHSAFRPHGKCEVCGEFADCVDCHRYDARQMSKEDRRYLQDKQNIKPYQTDGTKTRS